MSEIFSNYVPKSFRNPEQLPVDSGEHGEWQNANNKFWSNNPMRYDWSDDIEVLEGTKEYYQEIDKRLFFATSSAMPWRELPFDNLIPYDKLHEMDVLEIGVGQGSHASLIAPRSKSYTGIDLTEFAVGMTKTRLALLGVKGEILQMDAEQLKFPDASFDFVWSWGVIHHSANTRKILEEIHRVLRPGGIAVVMVYYRSWWSYYVVGALAHGVLRGGFNKYGSLARVVQANTDGALARYYSFSSWRNLVGNWFQIEWIKVSGLRPELFPMPRSRIKSFLMGLMPSWLAKFLLTDCMMGSFLMSELRKPIH